MDQGVRKEERKRESNEKGAGKPWKENKWKRKTANERNDSKINQGDR